MSDQKPTETLPDGVTPEREPGWSNTKPGSPAAPADSPELTRERERERQQAPLDTPPPRTE